MTKPIQIEIGLVLQGGGALGAYECGAVAALLELMDAAAAAGIAVTLKAVSGVSIGAINAACVVGARDRADAVRRLDALWDDLALEAPDFWPRHAQRDLSLFGLPGFYAPRIDVLGAATWTAYYDTSPLLETLARHIDFAALNVSPTTFIATAVDVESGELKPFSNKTSGDAQADKITAAHVKASGSLPPQFPWTGIQDRYYWDGGLVDNTPLGGVIDAFSRGPDIERIVVVMNLYPLRAPLPRNLADVEDRLHELCFGNRMRQDKDAARRVNDLICTIEGLAALLPDALPDELQARVDRAREFKVIKVVDVDVQDPAVIPRRQDPTDDEYGLRDFSLKTVCRRRAAGRQIGWERLLPIFASYGLNMPEPARRAS